MKSIKLKPMGLLYLVYLFMQRYISLVLTVFPRDRGTDSLRKTYHEMLFDK